MRHDGWITPSLLVALSLTTGTPALAKDKPNAAGAPRTSSSQAGANASAALAAGRAAMTAGEHSVALGHFQRAWTVAKPYLPITDRAAGMIQKEIGLAYVALNQDAQAEPFLRRALLTYKAQSTPDTAQIIRLLGNLADLATRLRNPVDAAQFRQEQTQLRPPSENPATSASPAATAREQAQAIWRAYNAAGRAASQAGDLTKALEQHQLAWATAKPYVEGTGRIAAIMLESIGTAYVNVQQDAQAEPFFRAALAEYKIQTPNEARDLADVLFHLSGVSARSGATEQAKQWRLLEIVELRKIADHLTLDSAATSETREKAWLALVATVSQLSDTGHTMEGFDQFEAALIALDNIPNTLESRLAMMGTAGSILTLFDTSKAQKYYSDGLRLVESMPEGDQKRLYLADFTQLLAKQFYALGRVEQATTQLQTALNYAQSAPPSPKRDALVSSISGSLSTYAFRSQKYSDAIRWSQMAFGAAQTDDARANALVSVALAELALKNLPEAKRSADQALALLTPSFDLKIPHLIMKRMFLSQIYADLGEKDRALALYDGALDTAKAIQSPIFSQFDIVYFAAGTKALQSANQAPRAYANLATAGRSLIEGPGRTFGVNLDSRRIFNEFRFVFKEQMQAGWIAAHADGAPPSQGASHETR